MFKLLKWWFTIAITSAMAAKTYGVANTYQVGTIGEFCFTIPEGKSATLVAQTVVHSPDQSFMLVRQNDWEELYRTNRGNLGEIGSLICQGDHSFLKEPLLPIGDLTSYDLKLSLPARFDNTLVYSVVANCKNKTNVEYSLSFENPGGIFIKHFSCQDRGMLQVYALFSVLTGILAHRAWRYYKVLSFGFLNMQLVCLYLAGLLQCVSVWLITIHYYIYGLDGLGINVVKYVSMLLETTAGAFLTVLMSFYMEGVGLVRPRLGEHTRTFDFITRSMCISTFTFLFWEELRYQSVYIMRLKMGDRLGGFGISPYCALFGTYVGLLVLCLRAICGLLFLYRLNYNSKQESYNDRQKLLLHRLGWIAALYFWVPIVLCFWTPPVKHIEVICMVSIKVIALWTLIYTTSQPEEVSAMMKIPAVNPAHEVTESLKHSVDTADPYLTI